MHFPVRSGLFIDRKVAEVHAVEDVSLDAARGRDARHRRRVGLRQDDAVALPRAAADADRRDDALPRPGHHDAQGGARCAPVRREVQMVFQDPQSSLNPRQRVGQIVGRPLKLRGKAGRERSSSACASCSTASA